MAAHGNATAMLTNDRRGYGEPYGIEILNRTKLEGGSLGSLTQQRAGILHRQLHGLAHASGGNAGALLGGFCSRKNCVPQQANNGLSHLFGIQKAVGRGGIKASVHSDACGRSLSLNTFLSFKHQTVQLCGFCLQSRRIQDQVDGPHQGLHGIHGVNYFLRLRGLGRIHGTLLQQPTLHHDGIDTGLQRVEHDGQNAPHP